MSSEFISASEAEVEAGPVAHSEGGASGDRPIDFIFLVDLSGSFGDDLPNFVASAPSIAAQLLSINEDSQFAIASFVDLPEGGFGSEGDYVYNADLPLTDNATDFQLALAGLETGSGGDFPESQLPALFYASAGVGLNLREDSEKIILVVTDAEYQTAASYGLETEAAVRDFLRDNAGIDISASGLTDSLTFPDGFTDLFISAICDVVCPEDITPIFAVTEGVSGVYEGVVDELGKGVTAPLSETGDNVSDALSFAIAEIAGSITEEGASGTDSLDGAGGADTLFGLDGDDTLAGGAGDDFLDGGSDNDTLTGGPGDDTVRGGTGDDLLNGGAGDDTLEPGLGTDTVILGTGSDRVSGTASELDGSSVVGFNKGDAIVVRIANLREEDFSVGPTGDGGTVVEIDSNFDGVIDATIQFDTAFDKDDLLLETSGFDTILSWPLNLPPTDILLSNDTVVENAIGGTVVADLTTLDPDLTAFDPDVGDAHTYTTSDDRFIVVDDQLLVADGAVIDYETEQSISLDITTIDLAGASLTLTFEIEVENVIEAEILDVSRFMNTRNGAHLFTVEPAEIDAVTTNMPWMDDEGRAFQVLDTDAIGTFDGQGAVPVYRLYNTGTGSHFYTVSETERDAALANNRNFVSEGVAFAAFRTSEQADDLSEVYRLFNLDTGRHHWTMSTEEVNALNGNDAWVYEGVAFYAIDPTPGGEEPEIGQATRTLAESIARAYEAEMVLDEDMFA